MKTNPTEFDRYLEVLSTLGPDHRLHRFPAITISRETGAGALSIGQLLVDRLGTERATQGPSPPWTLFDQNLAEKVLREHLLPARLADYMPEDVKFPLADAVEQILGLHPSSWTLLQHTTETILRLAAIGHVVLVGRGSNIIAARLPNVLHVRLVAPLEKRVQHISKYHGLNPKEAADFVRRTDQARSRYVRDYLHADVGDPLTYHLVINTGLTSYSQAAEIIVHALTALVR
jgi:hypothetical protein